MLQGILQSERGICIAIFQVQSWYQVAKPIRPTELHFFGKDSQCEDNEQLRIALDRLNRVLIIVSSSESSFNSLISCTPF